MMDNEINVIIPSFVPAKDGTAIYMASVDFPYQYPHIVELDPSDIIPGVREPLVGDYVIGANQVMARLVDSTPLRAETLFLLRGTAGSHIYRVSTNFSTTIPSTESIDPNTIVPIGANPVAGDFAIGMNGVVGQFLDAGSVITFMSIMGPAAKDGVPGRDGEPGVGITYKDDVETYSDLPAASAGIATGDAYFVNSEGKLYIFGESGFPVEGEGVPFQGVSGRDGAPGTTIYTSTLGGLGVIGSSVTVPHDVISPVGAVPRVGDYLLLSDGYMGCYTELGDGHGIVDLLVKLSGADGTKIWSIDAESPTDVGAEWESIPSVFGGVVPNIGDYAMDGYGTLSQVMGIRDDATYLKIVILETRQRLVGTDGLSGLSLLLTDNVLDENFNVDNLVSIDLLYAKNQRMPQRGDSVLDPNGIWGVVTDLGYEDEQGNPCVVVKGLYKFGAGNKVQVFLCSYPNQPLPYGVVSYQMGISYLVPNGPPNVGDIVIYGDRFGAVSEVTALNVTVNVVNRLQVLYGRLKWNTSDFGDIQVGAFKGGAGVNSIGYYSSSSTEYWGGTVYTGAIGASIPKSDYGKNQRAMIGLTKYSMVPVSGAYDYSYTSNSTKRVFYAQVGVIRSPYDGMPRAYYIRKDNQQQTIWYDTDVPANREIAVLEDLDAVRLRRFEIGEYISSPIDDNAERLPDGVAHYTMSDSFFDWYDRAPLGELFNLKIIGGPDEAADGKIVLRSEESSVFSGIEYGVRSLTLSYLNVTSLRPYMDYNDAILPAGSDGCLLVLAQKMFEFEIDNYQIRSARIAVISPTQTNNQRLNELEGSLQELWDRVRNLEDM
jgi:hypothetical protein